MQNLTKQFNFKTNPEILAEAQAVLWEKNLSMSSVLNSVIEHLATEKELPVGVEKDETEVIFQELHNEIRAGYNSYREGKKISNSEMRAHFGL